MFLRIGEIVTLMCLKLSVCARCVRVLQGFDFVTDKLDTDLIQWFANLLRISLLEQLPKGAPFCEVFLLQRNFPMADFVLFAIFWGEACFIQH